MMPEVGGDDGVRHLLESARGHFRKARKKEGLPRFVRRPQHLLESTRLSARQCHCALWLQGPSLTSNSASRNDGSVMENITHAYRGRRHSAHFALLRGGLQATHVSSASVKTLQTIYGFFLLRCRLGRASQAVSSSKVICNTEPLTTRR